MAGSPVPRLTESVKSVAGEAPLKRQGSLTVHSVLMEGLVDRAGKFRKGGVGVVQGTRVVLRYIFRRSDTTAREALALNLHPEMREQVMTMEEEAIQRGVEKGLQEGRQVGMQEGLRQKALEDARRMRDHGIAWEIVTDVTGIVPADLG